MSPIQEYAAQKIVRLIEMLHDNPDQSYISPKISFLILALQRISLIFPMDEFAGQAYNDWGLKQVRNFANWTTGQTPLTLTSSEDVAIWVLFIISLTHLSMSCILFFTSCQNEFTLYLLRKYTTYLFTLLITPSMLLATSNHYNNLQSLYRLALIPIIGNYILLGYGNRSYHLRSVNPYRKKYSTFKYIERIGYLVGLILYPLLLEWVYTLYLLIFSLICLLDAFFVHPFNKAVNALYSYATIFVLLMTFIKALAFSISQHHILHIMLVMVPLMGMVLEKIRQLFNQSHSNGLTIEQLIKFMEPLFDQQPHNNIHYIIQITQIQKQYNCEGQSLSVTIQTLFQIIINNSSKIPKGSHYNQNMEQICIYYVFFLTFQKNQPLQGYIALKKLEFKLVERSLYFRAMSIYLAKTLFNRYSINKGVGNQMQSLYPDKIKSLSVQSIKTTENLAFECVDKVRKVMNAKMEFWDDLSKGHSRIEDFGASACNLSVLIWEVRDKIFNELSVNPLNLHSQIHQFDAIQLKILALLFSVVLNDYYSTIEIEDRLEDVLQYERNIKTNEILSSTYMNDQLVLIQISLIRNRGKIVNKSKIAIAKFFGYNDQDTLNSLIQVEQLMPKYIANRHNGFIDSFIEGGHSRLFENSNEVIYQNNDGFNGYGNLRLAHIFENVNDYVLTGAVTKGEQQLDSIVFDDNGKILSISKKAFAMLASFENLSIQHIVGRCYIYFWFPEILEIMYSELQTLKQIETQDKISSFIISFYQIRNLGEAIRINNKLWAEQIPDQNNLQDVNFKEGVNLKLLTESMREYSYGLYHQFIKLNQIQNDKKISLQLQLTVNLLGREQIPIYIMKLQHISQIEISQTITQNFTNMLAQETLLSNFSQKFQQEDIKNQANDIDEARILQFNILTTRRHDTSYEEPLLQCELNDCEKKSEENNNSQKELAVDVIKEGSQSKSMNFDSVESHQEEQPKVDLIKVYKDNIQNNQLRPYRISNQSTTTTGKTQNKLLSEFRNIQYSQKLQRSIIKALITTTVLITILFTIMVIELQVIRSHTTNLQESIPLVRLSDRFNRLYCTFITIGEYDITGYVLNSTYGEYYDYRKIQESTEIRKLMVNTIQLLLDKFSLKDSQGALSKISIYIINEFEVFNKTTSFTEFSSMVNEHTQSVNYYLSQFSYQDMYNQQIEMQFLKANLYAQIEITSQIVEAIATQFFIDIENNQDIQLVFFIIKIFFIAYLTGLQFNMWKVIYKQQQRVLMLISRVQITDIEIIKLQYSNIIQQLERNSNKWKSIEYSKELYSRECSILADAQINQPNHSNKVTLTSKIYLIKFSVLTLVGKLLFICGLLVACQISEYYYQEYIMQSSQPEIQLCMQFVKFKSHFDTLLILSQLLKNQQELIEYTFKEQIFKRNQQLNTEEQYYKLLYDPFLVQFMGIYNQTFRDYDQIYEKIVASTKMSQDNKQYLMDLYSADICLYQEADIPFCRYENKKFHHFPNYPVPREIDNNREVYQQGINGIVNQVKSVLSSYYTQEQQGKLETDQTYIRQFLDSPAYTQVIFAYFFDLNKAFISFLSVIVTTSLDILEVDYFNIVIFYCTAQTISFIIVLAIVIWRAIRQQKQMRQTLQALIVLPHNRLLEPITYNALRTIVQNQ